MLLYQHNENKMKVGKRERERWGRSVHIMYVKTAQQQQLQ